MRASEATAVSSGGNSGGELRSIAAPGQPWCIVKAGGGGAATLPLLKPLRPRAREQSPGTRLAPQPKSSLREDRGRPGALSGGRWWPGARQARRARKSLSAASQRGAHAPP
eukprot:3838757-Pyramimonas_sp.AAC.1